LRTRSSKVRIRAYCVSPPMKL